MPKRKYRAHERASMPPRKTTHKSNGDGFGLLVFGLAIGAFIMFLAQ